MTTTREPREYEPCALCGVWTLSAVMDSVEGLARGHLVCPCCSDELAEERNNEELDYGDGEHCCAGACCGRCV